MARVSYNASAPGSLMLLGEHAVLHGTSALVCAINRRIRVSLTPRDDDLIQIRSALGECTLRLGEIELRDPFQFVIAPMVRMRSRITRGFDLVIESEFSHQVGLGSSAAVTVATVSALLTWYYDTTKTDSVMAVGPDLHQILRESIAVIRETQGVGSGADAAASVFGGIVLYRAEPIWARKLDATHPITVVYSGSKKPTAEVIRLVEKKRALSPAIYDALFRLMGKSAQDAAEAINTGDWPRVGHILDVNHGLMESIGVCNRQLADIVHGLREDPGILGAKISGSGLGDCAVGIGTAAPKDWPYEVLPVGMSDNGVSVEWETSHG